MATKVTPKRAIARAEREEDVLADIRAIKLETAQINRETAQLRREITQLEKATAAEEKQRKQEFAAYAVAYAAADEKRKQEAIAYEKKWRAERDRDMRALRKVVSAVSKQVGSATNSNGDAAEEYFINALKSKMTFAGIHYDLFNANMLSYAKERNIREEYDIVLLNGSSVAIIEIKYNAKDADFLSTFTTRKVENFRLLFPQYANHKIYLGVAAMSFDEKVIAAAKKLGVGILKQVGNVLESDTENIKVY
jgi:hypothetical protein